MFNNSIGFHTRRHAGTIKTGVIFGILFTLFISLIYPGDQGVQEMFNILDEASFSGLFAGFSLDSPAWFLWISFMIGFIVYYLVAVSSINIGSRIIPTMDDDGVEVLLGFKSISSRQFYIENIVAGLFAVLLILLPLFVISSGFTAFVYGDYSTMDEMVALMLIYLVIGAFYLALTSMVTVLTFSRKLGKVAGFGYMFYAFIIEVLADSPEYRDYGNISINYYIQPISIIFGNFEIEPVLVVLSLAIGFFLIAVWRVTEVDYIEKSSTSGSLRIVNPLSRLDTDLLSPSSGVARRYPILVDQFRLDLRAIMVVIGFITFQQGVIFFTLPSPENLINALQSSNSPAFSAFAQNHELQKSFLGFIVLKFYTTLWLFYGIVIAVIGASIPTRDVRTKTQDLLYANDVSPTRLVTERIVSMSITFTIIVWGSFAVLRGLQAGKVEIEFILQLGVFATIWVHYLGLGILLAGIAMIPKLSNGYKLSMAIFIIFVIFSFVPFLNPDIEFLKYVSYIAYFDPVGMIYGKVDFIPSFLTSVLLLVLSSLFTYMMTITRFQSADLL